MSPNESLGPPSDSTDVPKASPNPFAKGLNVTVSLPQTLEFRLVDASALEEYEVWSLLSSVLSNAALGFFVAYYQSPANRSLWYTALAFGILFLICVVTALYKRARLRRTAKRITLATMAIDEPA